MADILKVTTPGAGFDNNTIKNNPSAGQSVQIQNPIDPTKILRGDNRTDAGKDKDGQMAFQYDSNFGTFLHMLKTVPDLVKILPEIFFAGEDALLAGTLEPEAAGPIAEFFKAAAMEEGDVLPFMKEQGEAAVRFKGGLFTLLRRVMGDTSSVDLKAEVLDFVRKYNDMSSGTHILHDIENCIEDIKGQLFRQSKEQLDGMVKEMNPDAPKGDTVQNSSVLKGKILPFLGRYVTVSHDMGVIREKISLLTVLISRYENGDKSEVLQSFAKLTGYQGFRKFFGNTNLEQFTQVLEQTDLEQEAGKTDWSGKFVEFLKSGLKGAVGTENKAAFQAMVQAMAVNESVYMPILHMAFPVNLDGRMMFSELWIDPDEEGSSVESGEKPTSRLFVKFDIKDLGLFKLVLLYRDETASMQLYYPETMKPEADKIQKKMRDILQDNSLRPDNIYLQAGGGPSSPLEVFPKIQERKNSVDVRI